MADPDVTGLIAELGDATVGLAQWNNDRDATELVRLYVDRSCHGTDLGQALMTAVVADATGRGKRSLHLGVWDQNERAIAFKAAKGLC